MRWTATLIPPALAASLARDQHLTVLDYAFVCALAALFVAATLLAWGLYSKVFKLPFRED